MEFRCLRKPATALVCTLCLPASSVHAWGLKRASLMTKWAAHVNPKAPLPEYPRPQLVRSQWMNLNGIWQFQPGTPGEATPTGRNLSREILVPFPVDSALSGVMGRHDRLWYRRNFTVPKKWRGQQLKINFGAVDYESEVIVNGQSVGTHTGGYEPFSYDITPYLKGDGPQELIVRVFDSTDNGGQPRGKQSLNPKGIMYTPTTGIWQTVWLEPVAKTSIDSLHMVPDIDAGVVKMLVAAPNAGANVTATVHIKEGARVVQTIRIRPNVDVAIPVENTKLWSPESPFLYDVDVTLTDRRKAVDRVSSYFGMHKVSMGMADGFNRLLLNNKFTFQMGVLDQGFWPDGLYTAPTDEALASDVKTMKELGFNMVRKHIKVEPARWYYYCDKLGLLVWQDMPSENSYINVTGDVSKSPPLDKQAFKNNWFRS
ncbi:beta-galactosidase BoGH2A [Abditibacteriota bacterium]|nr:beta-galactosidase BoGH2A [Abditibacteriota bacterium]